MTKEKIIELAKIFLLKELFYTENIDEYVFKVYELFDEYVIVRIYLYEVCVLEANIMYDDLNEMEKTIRN